jgi:phage terminase Nu1 subunit (DNA packaging protein)
MTKTELDDVAEVSATELSGWLGLSRVRVGQLAAEGVLARSDGGKFSLKRSVLAYVHWRRAEDRRSSRSAIDARLTEARARALELRNAKVAGVLMHTAEHEELLAEIIAKTLMGFDQLPSRFTDDVPQRRRLDDLITEIRNEVAALMAAEAEKRKDQAA